MSMEGKIQRILCFGDSLTAGFHESHVTYSPYGPHLANKLGVKVDFVGISGWRSDEMAKNIKNAHCMDIFGKVKPGLGIQLAAQKYDACIIMAGTNDLGANRTADQIMTDVKVLHRYCHIKGVPTVALTIPEMKFVLEQKQAPCSQVRLQVNKMLQQWAATKPEKMLFLDMASQVPFSAYSGNWCHDGLHMSAKGYQVFGERLAELLRAAKGKALEAEPAAVVAPPVTQSTPKLRSGRGLKQLMNQSGAKPIQMQRPQLA